MKKDIVIFAVIICQLFLLASFSRAAADNQAPENEQASVSANQKDERSIDAGDDAWEEEWDDSATIADPLEPINRFFFHFNDKVYYWFLKPVARVYSGLFPDDFQIIIRNIFDNLQTPASAVSCLLQGRVTDSFQEVARFTLNSTVGILGAGDFAGDVLGLPPSNEDIGQALAFYGLGGVFYIHWPFLGPSNVRDTLGFIGDGYLHPYYFLDAEQHVTIGARIFERVNYTALTMGDYELFTSTALDPYAAVKDAYHQYRQGLIENK
ncbi:MAG: VacJ family lipoprotein [Desulfobulbales bacterium]|nr:VacJ family lipoprotein [Desulfobulbales bacterium]